MHLVVYVYFDWTDFKIYSFPAEFTSMHLTRLVVIKAPVYERVQVSLNSWHLNHNRRAGQTALDIKYSISSFNAVTIITCPCFSLHVISAITMSTIKNYYSVSSLPNLNHLATRILPKKYLKSSKSWTFAPSSNPLLKLFSSLCDILFLVLYIRIFCCTSRPSRCSYFLLKWKPSLEHFW